MRAYMNGQWLAHQVSPWPSWPYLHQPKVYTTPSESATMLCRHPQATDTTFTSSMLATCLHAAPVMRLSNACPPCTAACVRLKTLSCMLIDRTQRKCTVPECTVPEPTKCQA